MNNGTHLSFQARYNRMVLKLVSAGWKKLFVLERQMKKKIFIQEFEAREDDICVVTYMRSGTTLVQMMLYQLLTDGNMNFNHLSDISPLLEDAINAPQQLQQLPSPRIFKTHGDYKYFRRKSNARIVYVVRNGMDVASSIFHYHKNYDNPDLNWDKFLTNNFMDRLSWFKYVEDWLENKNRLNVCYLKYEDVTDNMRATIEKLAAFMKITPTEATIQRVMERCSFGFMKEHELKFGRKTDQHFIRKGKSNTGQFEFSEAQRTRFIELYNKHLERFNLGYDFSVNTNQGLKLA
ncbi:hypothetical protein A4H97_31935 [Niastella yeongjuensis]|uniref:Sulfotransferase domain-containing protein n=1 Tax=Niastella yeongjuensis TaxID=354355 RepID=A0A1V9EI93_9BACT|nr:sulfotransferase domain-containing protein [Niastella yeongjuensis]OQP45856.1 hypothetical protein A4H97_31935 [Niastella yeongjuensis]SEP46653.1 Sulfotransferase domain-containing protein [Niastella yeongjuensis]